LQGQKGLSVAFDLPTQMGYDSDDDHALGEVGHVGVSVNSLADMELIFDSIPLDQVSVSFTINSPAVVILAMFVAIGKKRGIPLEKLRGTVQNDILKEYVARGTYIFPPKHGMRLCADIIEYCANNLPNFNGISISGYHMREAGCTAPQELAFTLANGIAYVKEALARGMTVDDFAARLSFFFCAQNNFFEEIAKFRAARRLWAQIMRDQFGAKKPSSLMLRFHTQTAGASLTAQQPNNNVIRVAYQALAAVLGGTQSLHTNSRDEALSIPSEESVLLALRTQQLLAHETGIADVVDPLGGSYYIEALTDVVEEEARKYLHKIDESGGSLKCIERGYMQQEIQESAYKAQLQIENQSTIVIGVNQYSEKTGEKIKPFKFDEHAINETLTTITDLKRKRNKTQLKEVLAKVERAAQSNENIIPAMIEAVERYATIGEICNILRNVFGEYRTGSFV
jgi:methylmalonyl-CoA mutase N-terminal domain/subunit